MNKPILCVDFDGVIHAYTSGWMGAGVIADGPVPGAIQWLREAQDVFDVQIYSSRSKEPEGVFAMREWLWAFALHELGGPPEINDFMDRLSFPEKKPAAFLTVDDRAICFEGDFAALDPATMAAFKPWNKRAPPPPPAEGEEK